MFIAAGLCTWLLRSWKIGQVEQEAARRRERDDGDSPSTRFEARVRLTSLVRNTLLVGKKV